MQREPFVSIVLLDWNGLDWVKFAIPTIKKLNYKNYELIFVDNGSQDNASIDYVRQHYPSATVIKNEQNLGYGGALNKVTTLAQGKYLFFMQNDVKLDPDCLKELVSVAESDDKIGICACKQLSYKGDFILNIGVGIDIFGYPIGSVIYNSERDTVFYADGASFFVKKDVFIELNGFDEKHIAFGEDIDLCWRAWIRGFKVVSVPTAVVYHASGGTLIGGAIKSNTYITTVKRRYLGERNALRNVLKNYQSITLLWVLPLYLSVNLAEIILFLIIGKFNVVKDCYLKAWWYNITNFSDTWKQHKKNQRERNIGDKEIFKKMEWKLGKFEVFKKIGIPKFK